MLWASVTRRLWARVLLQNLGVWGGWSGHLPPPAAKGRAEVTPCGEATVSPTPTVAQTPGWDPSWQQGVHRRDWLICGHSGAGGPEVHGSVLIRRGAWTQAWGGDP